ncbi:MAG: hypothetical protein ACR2JY_15920 [Chloroflexota bacterium]
MAVVTCVGLRQQAHQFREAERNAVLPFPVVEGIVFFPKAELGEGVKASYQNDPLRDLSVRVRNLGRGPALYVQWNLTSFTSGGGTKRYERVQRQESRPFHLPQQATHELLRGPAHGDEKTTVGDQGQVTLWYRDTFGHEYRCVYEHQGFDWIELARGESKRETSRRRWWERRHRSG